MLYVEVANGTKCYCKAKESGKALDGWVDLSDASRQDLQATLKNLEAAKKNASAAPQAVSALEERIQQVKDAIYRCDPLHVQISKIQTAIGRVENTVKNRREQVWRSQEALTKAQDHLWELQGRLEQVTQRKEEEDQGYDSMDLQDGPGSWWDADSPGSDDVEHARSHRHRHSLGSLGVDISHHRSGTGRRVQSRICRPSLQRCSSTLATSRRSTMLSRRRSCW